MAIQQGVIQFRKKLGQTVGRLNANPSLSTNVTRGNILSAYQPIVKNPKTEQQGTQRMKMTAAVNFYRMLGQVLNNAFQSTKYGTKSRQRFMSIAMAQASGIPFVDKGDKQFYPGEFKISEGSLTPVGGQFANGEFVTTLIYDESLTGTTFGDFSQNLVNSNFGLLNGDRITLVSVLSVNGAYTPAYSYFVLNTDEDTPLSEVLESMNMVAEAVLVNPGSSHTYLKLALDVAGTVVAGGVIISRAPNSYNSTWMRSSCTMVVTDAYRTAMMSTERFNAALATYTAKAEALSSDWYLNLGLYTNPNGSAVSGSISIVSVENVTLSGSSIQGAVILMSDGTKRLGRYQDELVKVSGSSYMMTNQNATTELLNRFKAADSAITTWLTVPSANPYEEESGEDRP